MGWDVATLNNGQMACFSMEALGVLLGILISVGRGVRMGIRRDFFRS